MSGRASDRVQRKVLAAGALLAAGGIMLGAFAAHALRDLLDQAQSGWWHTAVQYQMWQAIGLIALAAAPLDRIGRAAALIAAGTLIFSGSLYGMALTELRWLGAVTPVGGALMIGGWLMVAWAAGHGGRGKD